jgi:hypothetical protein
VATQALTIQVEACLMQLLSTHAGEDTVRSIYTHLRQMAEPNSITRDLADFFAHPERNRGAIRARIESMVSRIKTFDRGEVRELFEKPLTHLQIMQDLNRQIERLNLMPIRKEVLPEVSLLLFLSMQGTSVRLEDKTEVLLSIAIREPEIAVAFFIERPSQLGLIVPVFSMPNYWKFENLARSELGTTKNWPILKTRIENGKRELFCQGQAIVIDFSKGGK